MRRQRNHSCEFVAGLLALIAVLWTPTAIAQSWFVDKTVEVGLGDYRAESGDSHGPGAVFADLDNDGYPDLYLMRAFGNPNELYHNVEGIGGARQFQAVPDQGGAGDGGDATGAIAGDYDNDGDLDLYVLNFDQPNVLFRNQLVETGQWVFIDVTAQTDPTPGVNDDQYGVGMAFYEDVALDNSLTAAWADVDRDGDLDLYVGNHNGNTFFVPEGPFNVAGRRDVFYINNGDGTFSDMTMAYGVPGYESADGEFMTFDQRFSSSNAVIFADFNNDGWPDLLVTNKVGGPTDRDMLYMNLGSSGDGTWLGFVLVTYDLVPTFGDMSGGAMGVDVADLDRDG
ncbi:MAG: VCBS repeat-containing protein, partial [Phycisphaerales bacterium]